MRGLPRKTQTPSTKAPNLKRFQKKPTALTHTIFFRFVGLLWLARFPLRRVGAHRVAVCKRALSSGFLCPLVTLRLCGAHINNAAGSMAALQLGGRSCHHIHSFSSSSTSSSSSAARQSQLLVVHSHAMQTSCKPVHVACSPGQPLRVQRRRGLAVRAEGAGAGGFKNPFAKKDQSKQVRCRAHLHSELGSDSINRTDPQPVGGTEDPSKGVPHLRIAAPPSSSVAYESGCRCSVWLCLSLVCPSSLPPPTPHTHTVAHARCRTCASVGTPHTAVRACTAAACS